MRTLQFMEFVILNIHLARRYFVYARAEQLWFWFLFESQSWALFISNSWIFQTLQKNPNKLRKAFFLFCLTILTLAVTSFFTIFDRDFIYITNCFKHRSFFSKLRLCCVFLWFQNANGSKIVLQTKFMQWIRRIRLWLASAKLSARNLQRITNSVLHA